MGEAVFPHPSFRAGRAGILPTYLPKVLLTRNCVPKTRCTDMHYKQMVLTMERRPHYGSRYNHLRVASLPLG